MALMGAPYVQCPHGIRLHTSVHDPTRDALAAVLSAALGPTRVLSESTGPGGHRAMHQWPDFTRCGILNLDVTDFTAISIQCRGI